MYDPSVDDVSDPTTREELEEELREELTRLHPHVVLTSIDVIVTKQVENDKDDNDNNKDEKGCIRVTCETIDMAKECHKSLHGRFFDGRKLIVEFV